MSITDAFHIAGQLVAVAHGANAPLLGRMIQVEMTKERRAMRGEVERRVMQLEEAVPGRENILPSAQ